MATRKNFPNRVEKRKSEAKTRQESYAKQTVEQKLAKAIPGSRQHDKLLAKAQK